MSIDCRSTHGAHDFCHCAMMAAGAVPAQPLDANWTRVTAGELGQFTRSVFNLAAGDGRLFMGTLRVDGTLASGWTSDLEPAVYLSVRNAATALARTALVIEATAPLRVFNVIDPESGSERDVWTARGWTPIGDGASEGYVLRSAAATGGRYHYRALISTTQIGGVSMVADAEFQAVVHRAAVRVETREMQVEGRSPGLHVVLTRGMEDLEFPAGARLGLRLPDGSRLAGDALRPDRFVQGARGSLRAAVLMAPPAGTYTIELMAIQGVGAHLLFQCTPAQDAMATMQHALAPIYPASGAGVVARSESTACALCRIALAAIGFTAVAAAVGAATILTGGGAGALVASIFASVGLTFGRALLVAVMGAVGYRLLDILCYTAGVCDAPAEVRRIVEAARNHLQRYDQMCYLTSHNAFSYRSVITPLSAQQSMPVAQQLERGVEALMLDLWAYTPAGGTEDIYLCHDDCEGWSKYGVGNLTGPRRLVDDLRQVVAALQADPERIVTLILEARIRGLANRAARLAAAFAEAGATPFLFRADQPNQGSTGSTWNVDTQGWPTRKWMIDNGLRLVVFSDRAAEIGCDDGWPCNETRWDDGVPYLWRYVSETVYGNASLDLSVPPAPREGSPPLTHRAQLPGGETRPLLLLMNYFPTFAAGSFNDGWFNDLNAYDAVHAKVGQVRTAAGRTPNFLAVDFFQIGANGGPVREWRELNATWSSQWGADPPVGPRAP
jgi:hypothetical protein